MTLNLRRACAAALAAMVLSSAASFAAEPATPKNDSEVRDRQGDAVDNRYGQPVDERYGTPAQKDEAQPASK